MRALMITTGFFPYTFSENLCNGKLVYALHKSGWEIDVISRTDEGPAYSSEWQEPWLPLKAHTYEVKYPVGTKIERTWDLIWSSLKMGGYPINGIRWARRAYEKAAELMKEKKYDVILTRSPNDIPHIVGYKLKKRFGVKWIANWNDPATTIWPEPYTLHLSRIKRSILERYNKCCLKGADIDTFPSKSLLDHYASNYAFLKDKRCEVIPHIALAEELFEEKERIKSDKMHMCHSGNLSKERNPENMFKAMREMIDEGKDKMQLDIMGQVNDYTKELIEKYRLEEYVKFAGSYPYMEAVKRLSEYDVLVLLEAILERGIFFASKFTDYAQTNRAILAVSPKEGFAKDMITEYGGGVVTNNEDYKDIKRGLEELYASWERGDAQDKYSTKRLYEQFSAEKVVEKYNEITK